LGGGTPGVPDYTISEENIKAIVDFLAGIENVREYELLPYHAYGDSKYRSLGREYPLSGLRPPDQEYLETLKEIVNNACCYSADANAKLNLSHTIFLDKPDYLCGRRRRREDSSNPKLFQLRYVNLGYRPTNKN